MVKIDANRKENIWGFAYNPTHFAGLQVFFQAFLNLNTIVFLFNRPQNEINNSIERFKISHISATPTFYRMILSAEKQFLSVTRITSGGEKFDQSLKEKVKCTFPNAKITNVYASTEAGTLFAAKDEVFIVKEDYREFVRIENSELLIHKNLMGESTDLFLENEWYRTGDMVQIESVNPLVFRFVNRKNEIINVGGYKINPYEVENAIMEINGISNCRVYGKKNSVIGNILIAEVQKSIESLTEREILSELKKKLQTFKLPRMIKFVDKLELTRTGKLKRQ
jgi:acyl-CoA synthetase (AMP-forming)/AMP-acid ligase II